MISIFPRQPLEIINVEDDVLGSLAYHFDAIMKINTELSATYTSYPVEFGVDMQDHAYNNPDTITIYGYTGSKELSISATDLPGLGVAAVVGKINNPYLSAAVGIGAEFLAGDESTRGAETLDFLKELKESFTRFDVVTDLIKITGLKIDTITTEASPENETGLEFIVVMSQQFSSDEEFINDTTKFIGDDPGSIMGAGVEDRGRIALV